MKTLFTLSVLLVSSSAFAAPLFSLTSFYSVKPDLKDAAPAITFPQNLRYEFEMTYSSEKTPSFTNHNSQHVTWKTLPAENGRDRFELAYEDYTGQTSVRVMPGMDPINTKQDFGIYLSGKALKMSGTGGQPDKVDNLDPIRNQLSAEVKDPVAKQALMMTFQESMLIDAARSYLQQNSCLREFGRKAVGSSWKMDFAAQGMKMGFECKFAGWADANGTKVAVIEIKIPKSRQETSMPMGGKSQVDSEGSGKLYYDPKSREALTVLDMDVNPPGSTGSKLHTATHSIPL